MVVIAMLGALTAAIAVNWASFMRHQELRGDAINLHKEIMALKARAIEYGYGDTLRCSGDSCTLKWFVTNDNGDSTLHSKTFKLNRGVVIGIGADITANWGDLAQITPNNAWMGTQSTAKIVATPDNIDAYGKWNGVTSANGARIVLSRENVRARYCIQKDTTSIRPELYYQSRVGGTWTRM
jgi:type II secretory pathway pseudopilin PulG